MNGPDETQITFGKFYPLQHMQPVGFLPQTEEAAALWYFLTCASIALAKVESQVTYEGDQDQTVDLMQLAHSVRKIYALDSLEGMFNEALIAIAHREAFRSALPWDSRLDAFFSSGGKAYRHLDRNPDKVAQ